MSLTHRPQQDSVTQAGENTVAIGYRRSTCISLFALGVLALPSSGVAQTSGDSVRDPDPSARVRHIDIGANSVKGAYAGVGIGWNDRIEAEASLGYYYVPFYGTEYRLAGSVYATKQRWQATELRWGLTAGYGFRGMGQGGGSIFIAPNAGIHTRISGPLVFHAELGATIEKKPDHANIGVLPVVGLGVGVALP